MLLSIFSIPSFRIFSSNIQIFLQEEYKLQNFVRVYLIFEQREEAGKKFIICLFCLSKFCIGFMLLFFPIKLILKIK